MKTFEIKKSFMLNGEPFKIISGAIHYFRILPSDWYHSLYNLKALGCNTVETYIPWNIHEPSEGNYCFENNLDIVKFVKLAQELDLFVILRPTPYICAEWEFGGLPAWLLKYRNMKIRTSDKSFIEKVNNYYKHLIPLLTQLEITNGGPVIMMQVENEYGSFGNEKKYLLEIMNLMIKYGVTVPLFTSDGPWEATQSSGGLVEHGVLSTGNFGSKSKLNFDDLQKEHKKHNKEWPLMCMEFWDGWFNRWNEAIVRRDAEDLAKDVSELLELGSINFYMFHGGTNFGFMNGCSARGRMDLPQITSYDYDAILNEQGNPTDKFYALQKAIKDVVPNVKQFEPLIKDSMKVENIKLNKKVSLFSVLDKIGTSVKSNYPITMEDLDSPYGYTLYRTTIENNRSQEKLKVIDASDRINVFLDKKFVTTQYKDEIGTEILINPTNRTAKVDVLVENLGRVNYGYKLFADSQRKGIRTGVMVDLHFISSWENISLDFNKINDIDFSKEWTENTPSFYEYTFDCDSVKDTFIDLSKFGKGCVFINGFNLGRFWNVGPTLSLYLPKALLKEKNNSIIIFETEFIFNDSISLLDKPVFKEMNQ